VFVRKEEHGQIIWIKFDDLHGQRCSVAEKADIDGFGRDASMLFYAKKGRKYQFGR
jgi:hypothetical protein